MSAKRTTHLGLPVNHSLALISPERLLPPPSTLPPPERRQMPLCFPPRLTPSQLCRSALPYFKGHFELLFIHESFQGQADLLPPLHSRRRGSLVLCASGAVLVPIMLPVFSTPSALLRCPHLLGRAPNSVTFGLKSPF